jgi:hypothetical protein
MVRDRTAARNGAAKAEANGRAHEPPDDDQAGDELQGYRLNSFRERTHDWLLPGRLAFGTLVIIGGDKQAGKSTFAGAVAAHLAGGRTLLPGQSKAARSGTLWVTSEEDPGRDVLPRIKAMGGDPARITIVGRGPHGRRVRMPCLPGEWDALGELAERNKARFLFIDGIASMIRPGLRLNDEGQARELFDPAAELAERTGLLVAVVRHNRKSPAATGFGQILGSVGVVGAARVVLQVRPLDLKTGLRVVTTETNMGPTPPPLLFRIEGKGNVGRLVWEGECSPEDRRIVDAQPDAGRILQGASAEAFVQERLKGGAARAKDVFADGLRDGYGSDALWRAAKRIGVEIRRKGFGPASYSLWNLPGKRKEAAEVRPVRSMRPMKKPAKKTPRKKAPPP